MGFWFGLSAVLGVVALIGAFKLVEWLVGREIVRQAKEGE